MKSYFKSIESRKRMRIKVSIENSTAHLTIITYNLPDNPLDSATWNKEERIFILNVDAQMDAYLLFIKDFQTCTAKEYQYALQGVAQKRKERNTSIEHDRAELPIPLKVIKDRIRAFLKSKEPHAHN